MTSDRAGKFIVVGASLDTGNLGVSALLASTVQCIWRAFPEARIRLLDGVRNPEPQVVQLADGQAVEIDRVGVRCNKTIWCQNHLLRLLGSAAFAKLLPVSWRRKWLRRNPYLNAIFSASTVMDITGGDSFSDIYGLSRLARGWLRKKLVLLCGANLILLPQTYGPFRRPVARAMARGILSRATKVFSRDTESLEEIKRLMNGRPRPVESQFCPDVAFVLDPVRQESEQTRMIEHLKAEKLQVVGLNISGLLYNGGHTGNNEFGLRVDYRSLVKKIVSMFAGGEDCRVLLVPHVIPKDFAVENDLAVCEEVWRTLSLSEQGKVIVLDGKYDQSEVKYLIGLCDFFMGARMHSTIAALSQCLPAVGMAYSKKFAGVFQTAGVAEFVIDMRQMDEAQILDRIQELYQIRESARRKLMEIMPGMQKKVMSLFDAIQCFPQNTQSAHRRHRPQPGNDQSPDYAD